MEKLIYDADSCISQTCPKFVIDEKTQVVSLIDREGNRANMTIEHFNKFVRAIRTGEVKELTSVKRK
jgi:hypothetical protein